MYRTFMNHSTYTIYTYSCTTPDKRNLNCISSRLLVKVNPFIGTSRDPTSRSSQDYAGQAGHSRVILLAIIPFEMRPGVHRAHTHAKKVWVLHCPLWSTDLFSPANVSVKGGRKPWCHAAAGRLQPRIFHYFFMLRISVLKKMFLKWK